MSNNFDTQKNLHNFCVGVYEKLCIYYILYIVHITWCISGVGVYETERNAITS